MDLCFSFFPTLSCSSFFALPLLFAFSTILSKLFFPSTTTSVNTRRTWWNGPLPHTRHMHQRTHPRVVTTLCHTHHHPPHAPPNHRASATLPHLCLPPLTMPSTHTHTSVCGTTTPFLGFQYIPKEPTSHSERRCNRRQKLGDSSGCDDSRVQKKKIKE